MHTLGMDSGRVMAGLSLHVVETARALGVDLSDVLSAHGLTLEQLRPSDAYVAVTAHEALWAAGATRTGRTDFGVYAAAQFPPGLTGAVEYIIRNCTTVRDAAESWVRLAPLVSDRISGVLVDDGPRMRLEWNLDRPASVGAAHWSEFAQARTLRMIRDALGEPRLAVHEVWFRHAALGPTDTHVAYFGSVVRHGRPSTALVWPRALLERPLQWVDAATRAALEARADVLRERLEASDADDETLVCRVRDALGQALRTPPHDTRLEPIAEALQLRPRTLQARIARQGVRFSALVDAVKAEEAQRLADLGVAAGELARRLGFQDASALRKARRRWARGGASGPTDV